VPLQTPPRSAHGSPQPTAAEQEAAAAAPDAGSNHDKDDDAGANPTPNAPPELLTPSKLPSIEGRCPDINGPGTYTFTRAGRSLQVDLYLRADARSLPAPGGPLILYFHSLTQSSKEVTAAVGQASIDKVIEQGGVVASFNASTCLRCGLAADVVWYDEDDAVSDQVVACVMQKAQIDTRRIHVIGFSAGALHTMHLALARSNYIASVVSYSGGLPAGPLDQQDPTNKVPALIAYGREGVDIAVVDFNIASRNWYNMFAPQGHYVLLCNHQRGHEIPKELVPQALNFLLDHPYRIHPEPYQPNIPASLSSYCHNRPREY
jgi:pimeloyl-ACP methyl ester carboxylesterase